MRATEKSKGYLVYLDILRLGATLCVILLHCINGVLGYSAIYTSRYWWFANIVNCLARAGVPLFFMISGYLLLNSSSTLDFAHFYKKRLLRILPDFLLWDIICYIYYSLSDDNASIGTFFKELINNGSAYHLWFVYTLAGVYLLAPFLKRIIDACELKHLLILLLIIVFPTTIRPFLNTVTPFYIGLYEPLLNGYLAYFFLGYILGRYDFTRNIRTIIYLGGIFGLMIGIGGVYFLSSPNQIELSFNNACSINHFLLAAALFTAVKHSRLITSLSRHNTARSVIIRLSALTYIIYLCHVIVLDMLQRHLPSPGRITGTIVYFLLTLIISIVIAGMQSWLTNSIANLRKKGTHDVHFTDTFI